MKKTYIIICLLVCTLCLFTGCNNKDAGEPSSEISENQTVNQVSDPGLETGGKIDNKMEAFETKLKDDGMKLGERVPKDASALGAKEGYGFNINDIPVEIYLFDKNSSEEWTAQNLKSAEESQTVTIFGVEVNGETPTLECALNDGLIVVFPLESMMPHPDKDKIIEIFKTL